MKKKLQKDLRWLKKLWVKIVLSIGLGFVFTIMAGRDGLDIIPYQAESLWLVILTGVSFLFFYLFTAWLYGDEQTGETK